MKIPFALLPLLLLAPSITSGANLSDGERDQLLGRLAAIREKTPGLQADYVERKSSRLLAKPLVSSGTLAFSVPNQFRREVRGSAPSTTVSDGRTMWIYYPSFNEAERYRLGQQKMLDDSLAALTTGMSLERVNDFYDVDAARDGNLYRLVLHPRRASARRLLKELTLWLDEDLGAVRSEMITAKGERVSTEYKNFRRLTLPAATFRFDPPKGARITDPMGK